MKITNINQNASFKSLYYSTVLEKAMANSKASSSLLKKTAKITDIIKNIGADRKKYVDIILNFDKRGFYGVISSKKQGTPMNPDYLCKISNNSEDIKHFNEWVNMWNYMYSPKGLREKSLLEKKLLKIFREDKNIRKALNKLA